jgi:hypothetical protein
MLCWHWTISCCPNELNHATNLNSMSPTIQTWYPYWCHVVSWIVFAVFLIGYITLSNNRICKSLLNDYTVSVVQCVGRFAYTTVTVSTLESGLGVCVPLCRVSIKLRIPNSANACSWFWRPAPSGASLNHVSTTLQTAWLPECNLFLFSFCIAMCVLMRCC